MLIFGRVEVQLISSPILRVLYLVDLAWGIKGKNVIKIFIHISIKNSKQVSSKDSRKWGKERESCEALYAFEDFPVGNRRAETNLLTVQQFPSPFSMSNRFPSLGHSSKLAQPFFSPMSRFYLFSTCVLSFVLSGLLFVLCTHNITINVED